MKMLATLTASSSNPLIAGDANPVIEIAGDEVTRARRDAADEVVLTVVNLKGYGAVGDRRRARSVCADVVALDDVAGAGYAAAIFDQDAVVDVAGDDVARGGTCTADLVAVGALEIDACIAVAVGDCARRVRADEVAFDVRIRGGALVEGDAVDVEAVDDQAPHSAIANVNAESVGSADAVAVQFDK